MLAIHLHPWATTHAAERKIPFDVPPLGLSLHLESSLGRIEDWQNLAGRPATLSVTGQPAVLANTLNNHPVIQLTADDALYYTATTELADQFNDRTMIVLLAQSNLGARIGYEGANCVSFFGFSWNAGGEGSTKPGCKSHKFTSTSFAPTVPRGAWQLHTSVLQGGTLFHLRNGRLIDGSQHLAATNPGTFAIEPQVQNLHGDPAQIRYLRIAAVLVYDRALAVAELNRLHSYLSNKYFANPAKFTAVRVLDANNFPAPEIRMWADSSSGQSLLLGWKARFADECGADTPWTASRSTEGEASVQDHSIGSTYGLHCWHARGSSTASVTYGSKTVVISWSEPEAATTGTLQPDNLMYQLLVGQSSGVYDQKFEIDPVQHTSFTLNLMPGTYFVAMKTLSAAGDESPLSPELAFRVN